jgi:hypothetical protein
LDNQSKVPLDLQVIRLGGGHKFKEFLPVLTSEKNVPVKAWLTIPGGVGAVTPGHKGTATVRLKAGKNVLFSTGEDPTPFEHGAVANFEVTAGDPQLAPFPQATANVAMVGHDDHYKFRVSGLQSGDNTVLMDNQSKQPHFLLAVPINKNYTLAQVKKEVFSLGPNSKAPPKTVDFPHAQSTAVIDGKAQMVSGLHLQSGRYALICFLTDRDGKGKPHAMEGMFQETTIK